MDLLKGCLSIILGFILLFGLGFLTYNFILVEYLGLPVLTFGKYILTRIAFAIQIGTLMKINTIKTIAPNDNKKKEGKN